MGDETLDACLRLPTSEIKADIDTIKKQCIVLLLCQSAVYFF